MRFVIHKEEGLLFQTTEKCPTRRAEELREPNYLGKRKTIKIKNEERISKEMERMKEKVYQRIGRMKMVD